MLLVNLSFLGLAVFGVTKVTFSSLEKYFREVSRIHAALFKQVLPGGTDWLFLIKAGLLIGLIAAFFYGLYEFFKPEWVRKSSHPQENSAIKYNQRIWQKISREPYPDHGTLLGVNEENKKYIVKKEKSFIVHPDEIKRLRVGEAIIVKKFPQFSIDFVKVKS
jgi:hypothetical protein